MFYTMYAWFTPWERRFPKSSRHTLLDSSMEMEPSWPSSSATRPSGSGVVFESGSRQPSCVSVTWRGYATNLAWVRSVRAASVGSGWSRTSLDARWLLNAARVKAQQIGLALQILELRINSIDDVQQLADWADALAALNVRSRGRRQNTAAMIQGFVSRND